MSLNALPILLINLNGEMLYILEQRLRAQQIPPAKIKKVMFDITSVMFNKRFVDELFHPQEIYPKKSLRALQERFAHASVMRLNPTSMDKLNDLMTMAVKYQVSLCKRPQDLLLVTLNHIDIIRSFVKDEASASDQLDYTYSLLHSTYASMLPGTFMLVRQKILGFLQDCHVRVSIFLRDKVQHNVGGRFVLPISGLLPVDVEVPGKIRLFSSKGEKLKTIEFKTGAGSYTLNSKKGTYDIRGDRAETLGLNMYNSMHVDVANVSGGSTGSTSSSSDYDIATADPRAKAQLDLLSELIGAARSSERRKGSQVEFRLNLFNDDDDDNAGESKLLSAKPVSPVAAGYNVVNIDASKKRQSAELARVMGDMRIDSGGDAGDGDDDLLDLMDSAAARR